MNFPSVKHLSFSALIGALGLNLLLSACGAGSGAGLNSQGLPVSENPSDDSEPTDGVTLAQLQADIFGPICALCHTGAGAPRGLRLDSEDNSYAFLVERPADEVPSLFRVDPGNPEQSYIIHKLEGRSGIVGSRMPLGGPYLSQAQIDQVRDWIANGAPRAGTGTGLTQVSRLSATQAPDGITLELHFSRALDDTSLKPGAIALVPLAGAASSPASIDRLGQLLDGQQLWLHIPPLPAGVGLRLHIANTTTQPLLDRDNRQIDGDRDNFEGGEINYVFEF